MSGEILIQRLSERIGQLEVENIMLKIQLEEMAKKLEEADV